MKRITVGGLPEEALAAAGVFHQLWLSRVESALAGGDDVMIAMSPADHTQRDWRNAVVAGLARKHTPRRVNAVAGSGAALEPVETYLAGAPGVTGQYFQT